MDRPWRSWQHKLPMQKVRSPCPKQVNAYHIQLPIWEPTSVDKTINAMESPIRFLPWVGSNYSKGFKGVRTLVLGESHYQWAAVGDINTWSTITPELVQEQIDGHYTKAFWTKIAITFLNQRPSRDEKEVFWHSVAFYNYVQESAGDGPRQAPSEGSWDLSVSAFQKVIEDLSPDFMLVLGDRLMSRLPSLGRVAGTPICDAPRTATWIYSLGNVPTFTYGGF